MKLIFTLNLYFIILSFTSCVSNQMVQKTSDAKNLEINKKLISQLSGFWTYTTETSAFDLSLSQTGGSLSGAHFSTMLNGSKVDCGIDSLDASISATVNNSNFVTVDVKSYFSGATGKATIRKINDTQIEWKLIAKPKGEYYLPDNVVLNRK